MIKNHFYQVTWAKVFPVMALLLLQPLSAQNALPAELRINGKTVWQAFEPQREVLQTSSAVIYTDGRSAVVKIFGTIVSEDGYILTKASEIEGASELSLRIGRELYKEVQVLGTDPEWDVAILKIEPEQALIPVSLSEAEDIRQGSWVISNGASSRSRRRVKIGVVSANTREIVPPATGVLLGVVLGEDSEEGLEIKEVSPESGAEKAGLQKDDVIRAIDGVEIKGRVKLLETLEDKEDGDKVLVEIFREGKKKEVSVELQARPNDPKLMTRNDQMGGGELSLSERRTNFPRALHHDTPLSKARIGGPLLDLDGICVGMNIARASRVSTLAIPARELREIIEKMKP